MKEEGREGGRDEGKEGGRQERKGRNSFIQKHIALFSYKWDTHAHTFLIWGLHIVNTHSNFMCHP